MYKLHVIIIIIGTGHQEYTNPGRQAGCATAFRKVSPKLMDSQYGTTFLSLLWDLES